MSYAGAFSLTGRDPASRYQAQQFINHTARILARSPNTPRGGK
jgi:hypothetical protein